LFELQATTVPLFRSATSNCQPQAMALTFDTFVGTELP
jgi:hypothetical protein